MKRVSLRFRPREIYLGVLIDNKKNPRWTYVYIGFFPMLSVRLAFRKVEAGD